MRADGIAVLITLHPSALLRADADPLEAGFAAWLTDLGQAQSCVDGAAPARPL